jgi:hypothetical protein
VDGRDKPGHDEDLLNEITDSIFKEPIRLRTVIPGRAKREPGIHNHDREYGFRACAKWRIHDVQLHIGE